MAHFVSRFSWFSSVFFWFQAHQARLLAPLGAAVPLRSRAARRGRAGRAAGAAGGGRQDGDGARSAGGGAFLQPGVVGWTCIGCLILYIHAHIGFLFVEY